MRKLTSIWSLWYAEKYPSHKIVLEWEEILASTLNLKIKKGGIINDKFHRLFEKYDNTELYHRFWPKHNVRLDFVMCAQLYKKCEFNKNTIPVIIDYWLNDSDIPTFVEVFKHCPLVLLTNKEVYDLLKSKECGLNIEHWPLSYPDYYKLTKDKLENKVYEFSIIGRPNPFFIRMLDKYCETHQDFTYIMNNGDINNRQYINHRGEVVADGNSRKAYLDMIKKTKISCYTTPGIDESKSDTSRFNQVTPRVFELLANGCQVIGHYPNDGADVVWYNLSHVVPNVDTYEEFENVLDNMRNESFDFNKISEYMEHHYTTSRANMLRKLLLKHNIIV